MSLVVSDTTPLNYLVLIGHVDILGRIFEKVLVPPAVIREMSHPKAPPQVSEWARNLPSWAKVLAPTTDLRLDVGAGEDEAISLAVELGNAALLVDDRKAREAAAAHGVTTFGTLAVLDLADELGMLDFESAVVKLRTTTFHIEASLLTAILMKVRQRKRQ